MRRRPGGGKTLQSGVHAPHAAGRVRGRPVHRRVACKRAEGAILVADGDASSRRAEGERRELLRTLSSPLRNARGSETMRSECAGAITRVPSGHRQGA